MNLPVRRALWISAVCLLLLGADQPDLRQSDTEALAPAATFVGQWRGVGQVRRGSSDGAWLEKCAWAWKFSKDHAELAITSADGKYIRSAALRPAATAGKFEFAVVTADEKELTYLGGFTEDGQLVVDAAEAEAEKLDLPPRFTFRQVAGGKRLLVQLQRPVGGGDLFTRVAEIGYTRIGSTFGKDASQPECIVTGGLGTSTVTFQGKTYYVCCTGCRDFFNENPQQAIDEYQAKLAKRKAAAEEKK